MILRDSSPDFAFADNKGHNRHGQVLAIPHEEVDEGEDDQTHEKHAKADKRRNNLGERRGFLQLRHNSPTFLSVVRYLRPTPASLSV
jgi:hypothetical protein